VESFIYVHLYLFFIYFLIEFSCKPGSWRLRGLNVMVIPPSQSMGNPVDNLENLNSWNLGLYYSFRTNDVLLGEDGDSADQLRPFKMQELSGNDI